LHLELVGGVLRIKRNDYGKCHMEYCRNLMDIVHVASEFAPIVKVGGLGDVISGLSKACAKMGHRVQVILPKYDFINLDGLEEMRELEVKENGKKIVSKIWKGDYEGVKLLLIDPQHPKKYFKRGTIYGEDDDNDRFLFFNKVACAAIDKKRTDVVHLHDWMAAGCTLFLRHHPFAKMVFTIHNLKYQGRCSARNLERLDIDYDQGELSDPIFEESLNLMRAAIQYCDAITAVSPSYAKEILTSEQGCDIEGTLIQNRENLSGILNGVDTDYWNPETDPLLPKNYTFETHKEGKAANKRHVQERLGLSLDPEKPLIVAITRLVPQKGPDLIHYGMEKVLEHGGQFVLLGSEADEEIREEFEVYQNEPNVVLRFEYDEPLSHLLYSGSDMFLMPSIFEPCGLSQMIALRYGSVPLVRRTGGLKDTIFDEKNGFTFDIPDNKSVALLMEKAFAAFGKKGWDSLIEKGMSSDLSWDTSAKKYLNLYVT